MRGVRLIVATLTVAALAGCAGRPAAAPAPPTGASAAVARPADPVDLIGLWKLSADGEEAGAALLIDGTEFRLFRRCTALFGDWDADERGLFVADASSQSPHTGAGCPPQDPPADVRDLQPAWLTRAVGFRAAGAGRELLDAAGAAVARLEPGAQVPPWPGIAAELFQPPVVTEEIRSGFRPAAALPAGLTPAGASALHGRWVPARSPGRSYVEFQADGRWTGSDGCNGAGGRWVAGPGGAFLGTTGASTLIGCENVPVASWLADGRRAGLDGAVLVLVGADGKELGRLTRGR